MAGALDAGARGTSSSTSWREHAGGHPQVVDQGPPLGVGRSGLWRECGRRGRPGHPLPHRCCATRPRWSAAGATYYADADRRGQPAPLRDVQRGTLDQQLAHQRAGDPRAARGPSCSYTDLLDGLAPRRRAARGRARPDLRGTSTHRRPPRRRLHRPRASGAARRAGTSSRSPSELQDLAWPGRPSMRCAGGRRAEASAIDAPDDRRDAGRQAAASHDAPGGGSRRDGAGAAARQTAAGGHAPATAAVERPRWQRRRRPVKAARRAARKPAVAGAAASPGGRAGSDRAHPAA